MIRNTETSGASVLLDTKRSFSESSDSQPLHASSKRYRAYLESEQQRGWLPDSSPIGNNRSARRVSLSGDIARSSNGCLTTVRATATSSCCEKVADRLHRPESLVILPVLACAVPWHCLVHHWVSAVRPRRSPARYRQRRDVTAFVSLQSPHKPTLPRTCFQNREKLLNGCSGMGYNHRRCSTLPGQA